MSFARHTAVAEHREEQSRFEGVFFPDVSSLHQGSSKVMYKCKIESTLKRVVSAGTLISVPHIIFEKRKHDNGVKRKGRRDAWETRDKERCPARLKAGDVAAADCSTVLIIVQSTR